MADEVVPNGGAVTDSATTSAATTSAATTSAAPASSGAATSSATTSAVASSSTSSSGTASATTSATSATTSATAETVDYAKAIKDSVPEGFTYDEKQAGVAGEIFAKHNIPQAAVADLINLYASQIKAGTDGNAAAFQTQVKAWETESKADKELGAENMGIAKMAVSKAFDTTTAEVLERFGMTNHPGFLKAMAKIGKAIKDDSWVTGGAGNANGAADARKHFPNSEMNP